MTTQVPEIFSAARSAGQEWLGEITAKQVLKAHGINVPAGRMVPFDAEPDLDGIALPCAAKLVSPQLVHKSDIGGVKLNLGTEAAVREAIADLQSLASRHGLRASGVLLEQMAPPGVEIVIGGIVDRCFGPVLMAGLGGVFVEIFKDIAFRVCPVTETDAREMLAGLQAAPLLRGARGGIKPDLDALVRALLAVGGEDGLLCRHQADIAELDINPLIVSGGGALACDARIRLAVEQPRLLPGAGPARGSTPLNRLFHPQRIAVIGASSTSITPGNEFIRHSLRLGYQGEIIPVHPLAATIEGFAAVRSFADIDGMADLAYIAVKAGEVPEMISLAKGKVRFAQVMSSGFGETPEGAALERTLVEKARAADIRVVGPNCLGLYSPRSKLSFIGGTSGEPGPVGVITQSGGLAADIILRGESRGLRFSAVLTVGNSADLGPAELLQYFFDDAETRVIGLYAEDVKDGRAFFDVLRENRGRKPVVVLLGGQTSDGRRAAASHTGSLASQTEIWHGLARQTGLVVTDTLDEFLDALLAFQTLKPHRSAITAQCVLFGNGGGTSVLATDAFARRKLQVSPFAPPALNALEALGLPPGTSVANPIDTPTLTLRQDAGRIAQRILEIVLREARPDAIVMHLNLPMFMASADQRADFLSNILKSAIDAREQQHESHFLLVLRSDESPAVEARRREFRRVALDNGIPVYDEMARAADALAAVSFFEQYGLRAAAQAGRA